MAKFNPDFCVKKAVERITPHHAAVYTTQHAIPGYGLYQGFSEYERYFGVSDGFGN